MLKSFVISVLVTAVSLWLIDQFSDSINFKRGKEVQIILMLSLLLNCLNISVTPILQFLGIPITILTLGLFYFVINGFVLFFAFNFVKGAKIKSFGTAIWVNIILTALEAGINWLLNIR